MKNQSFSQEFITALLTKANITDEKGNIDKDYVERLAEQLDKKIGIFVMGKLSADDLEAYYQLEAKKPSPEELNSFFKEKIPNFVEEQKKLLDDYAYNFFSRVAVIKGTDNK